MVRECIIITWKRATSSHDALQLAKRAKLLLLRECEMGHQFTVRGDGFSLEGGQRTASQQE